MIGTTTSTPRLPGPRRPLRPRPLTSIEHAFATEVFGLNAEWLATVRILGVSGLGGRAFTLPGPGRRVYIGLGAAAPMPMWSSARGYPRLGQLLIHELVHVWQRHHLGALRYLWRGLITQSRHARGVDVYSPPDPTTPWATMTIEQQATVIDRWFGGQSSPRRRPCDPDSPSRHYLDHVRAARRTVGE